MFVYTIQPVVKPVDNRFDNRFYEQWLFVQHGCQTVLTTGLTTGWMFVYTIQPLVKPVVQPVRQLVVSCKRGITVILILTLTLLNPRCHVAYNMIGRPAAAWSYWSEANTCRAVLNCFYSNSHSECVHCRRTLTNEIKLRRKIKCALTTLLGLIKAMRIISAIIKAVRPPIRPKSFLVAGGFGPFSKCARTNCN